MNRILVCGSRSYNDCQKVQRILNWLCIQVGLFELVVGDCPTGADLFVRQWANNNQIVTHIGVADWKLYGKAAGPIRNEKMLKQHQPNLVIAFGQGKGTDGMVKIAEKVGIKVSRFT